MKGELLRIGTAGWNIPLTLRDYFHTGSSHLEGYSQVFNAVEINTSFHKPHKKNTYERWALATPSDFQFAVKMYKQITHVNRLVDSEIYIDSFLGEVSGLQNKLGPLLIQLPPSLDFELEIAESFFNLLRTKFNGRVVLEPRHISWMQLEAVALLHEYNIQRVIVKPVVKPLKSKSNDLFEYYRLHGSPKMYSSSYDDKFLDQLAKDVNNSSWVIFDNTRLGAATQNALDLKHLRIGINHVPA